MKTDDLELLTEREAAKLLKVNPGTLRVRRCCGAHPNGMPVIPYVRIGRAIRYRIEDLRAFIEAATCRGGAA